MGNRNPRAGRRYLSRWSVIAFVVLAVLIAIAVMVWQMRGEAPRGSDVGLGRALFAGPVEGRAGPPA